MFLIEYINNLITLLIELKNSNPVISFFFRLVGIAIAFVFVKELMTFVTSCYSIYSRVKATSKEQNDRHFIAKSAGRMAVDELLGFFIMFIVVIVCGFILGKIGLDITKLTNLFV
jgi:hypothetical protein